MLAAAPIAQAQTAPVTPTPPVAPAANPAFDPAATALLEQSAKAYTALNSVAMDFTAYDKQPGKTTTSSGVIAFSRPNKAKIQFKAGTTNVLLVTDGAKLVMQTRPEEYMSQPVEGNSALQGVLQRIPSAVGLILPPLVAGEAPMGIEQIRWQKTALLPDNGVSLSASAGAAGPVVLFKLYFGANDQLLRRVEAEITVNGQKSINITSLSNIRLSAEVPETAFTFTPAAGAKLVTEPSYYAPSLKVGTKPFDLAGRDLQGNTHPWSKYAGKVVLLDFWATWCGPCIAEVPFIQQNIKKYQKSGFRVLGVSLDESKTDLQTFVKARKLSYPSIFDGRGWQNVDARRYEVQAIPFSLLIGKDGKIAAVSPRGPELEKAIQKALKAK